MKNRFFPSFQLIGPWRWVLGCGLVLLLGCKSQTAADVSTRVPFELLEAGVEPRAGLRYAIANGTTTTTTLSIIATPREASAPTVTASGLQSMEIEAVLGPAEVDEREIRYSVEIVASKAVAGPGASKKLVEEIEEHADFLKGTGSFVAINDRGYERGRQSNQRTSDVPVRLLWIIDNAVATLSIVGLPEEEVGVGARWKIGSILTLYGIKMEQQATYTLIERVGDEIVLDMELWRVGERQTAHFPEDDASVEVESSRATATGRIRLDLRSLGANATATGDVHSTVVLVENGDRERQVIDEKFEIRTSSTTSFVQPESEKR